MLYKANINAYQNLTLDVKQKSYSSVPDYTVSDHKPVYAEFNIKVRLCYVFFTLWHLYEEAIKPNLLLMQMAEF